MAGDIPIIVKKGFWSNGRHWAQGERGMLTEAQIKVLGGYVSRAPASEKAAPPDEPPALGGKPGSKSPR